MLPLSMKSLFLYLSPFNFIFGEYGAGVQYYLNHDWALDFSPAYIYEYDGSPEDILLNDIFNTDKIFYQGPSLRAGLVRLYPSGVNPLRTDYNEIELVCRYLWYNNVDFIDEPDTGKVFNISEKMQVAGLSYLAGYEIVNKNSFRLDGFAGFGLQVRFRQRTINSYGYNYNSSEFMLDEEQKLTRLVPMLNAGLRIGIKTRGGNE